MIYNCKKDINLLIQRTATSNFEKISSYRDLSCQVIKPESSLT